MCLCIYVHGRQKPNTVEVKLIAIASFLSSQLSSTFGFNKFIRVFAFHIICAVYKCICVRMCVCQSQYSALRCVFVVTVFVTNFR